VNSYARVLRTAPRALTDLAAGLWLALGATSLTVALILFAGVAAIVMLAAAPAFLALGFLLLLRPRGRWVLLASVSVGLVVAVVTAFVALDHGGLATRMLLGTVMAGAAANLSVPALLATRAQPLQVQPINKRLAAVGALAILIATASLSAFALSPYHGCPDGQARHPEEDICIVVDSLMVDGERQAVESAVARFGGAVYYSFSPTTHNIRFPLHGNLQELDRIRAALEDESFTVWYHITLELY
jgi:hypothetical protein